VKPALSEKNMNDEQSKIVINDFLRQHKDNIKIDKYPDEENRKTEDIDAVAGSLAIEHTSIDTVLNQRQTSDWFMQVIGGLESELNPQMEFYLKVIFPWEAITKGQNWQEIRNALKNWIINDTPSLAAGRHKINIPSIPFEFTAWRDAKFSNRLVFARFAPEDSSLPSRIADLIKRKKKKLEPYKKDNYTTILIIESNDMALMNGWVLLESIQNGFPEGLNQDVDELWYADTCIPENLIFENFTEEIKTTR